MSVSESCLRCAAYDPFNRMSSASVSDPVEGAHVYTIQPVEFGRCASCGAFEKRFLTGEELTVRDMLVCQSNDWDMVKQYYIQGIKGLLTVYNREVRRESSTNMTTPLRAMTDACAHHHAPFRHVDRCAIRCVTSAYATTRSPRRSSSSSSP